MWLRNGFEMVKKVFLEKEILSWYFKDESDVGFLKIGRKFVLLEENYKVKILR